MTIQNVKPGVLSVLSTEQGYTQIKQFFNSDSDYDLSHVGGWRKAAGALRSSATYSQVAYNKDSRVYTFTGLSAGTSYDLTLAFLDNFISGDSALISSEYQNIGSLINFTNNTVSTVSPVTISGIVNSITEVAAGSPFSTLEFTCSGVATELHIEYKPSAGSTWSTLYKGPTSSSIKVSVIGGTYNVRYTSRIAFSDGTSESSATTTWGSVVSVESPLAAPSAVTSGVVSAFKSRNNTTAAYDLRINWNYGSDSLSQAKKRNFNIALAANPTETTNYASLDWNNCYKDIAVTAPFTIPNVGYRTPYVVRIGVTGWGTSDSAFTYVPVYVTLNTSESAKLGYVLASEIAFPTNTKIQVDDQFIRAYKVYDAAVPANNVKTFELDAATGNVTIGTVNAAYGNKVPFLFDSTANKLQIDGRVITDQIEAATFVMSWLGGVAPSLRTAGKTSYDGTAAGLWAGYTDASTFKFNIGDATKFLKWDGSELIISGNVRIGTANGQTLTQISAPVVLSLTASAQVFTYDGNNAAAPTNQTITLTANKQNTSSAVVFSSTPAITMTGTGDSRTIAVADFTALGVSSVTITATVDGISDKVSIVKIKDGATGASGTAVTGFLTNEAMVVSAASNGTGYSLASAGGTFKVFSGLTDVTTSSAFSITGGTAGGGNVTKTQNGLTLTISQTTGAYTLSGASWTTDVESFNITAVYSGVTLTKAYNIAKSKTGSSGANGSNGADGTSPVVYDIESSSPVIFKDAPDAGTTGVYVVPATITGARYTGNIKTANFGFLTVTANGDTEAATATAAPISGYTLSTTSGKSSLTVRLYDSSAKTTLLDTQVIPVVFKGATGSTGSAGIPGSNGLNFSEAKMLYTDPTFQTASNSIAVYNNSGNGAVTITREAKQSDSPYTDSNFNLKISVNNTASPGLGGFVQNINSRANAVFVQRIMAKVPVGYNLQSQSNALGDGATKTWITSTAGTGKFEEYIVVIKCGPTGTFSSGGHINLAGTPEGTAGAPVNWYVAYATVFDFTAIGFANTTGVLSNEAHTVPTDVNGNNGNFAGAATTMYLYNGVLDDSANWTVAATPTNCTGSLVGKTYTVTAMSADVAYVDLTASRSGFSNVVKRFTLTKSKQGTAGTNGSRGAGRFTASYAAAWPATFDTAIATAMGAATTGGTPVVNDVVTLYSASDASKQYTRVYVGGTVSNTASWAAFDLQIHGNALVDGTLVASKVAADILTGKTLTADEIQTRPKGILGSPRVVLGRSAGVGIGQTSNIPFAIYNSADQPILFFDTVTGELAIDGQLGTNTIRTLDSFSPQLRAILVPEAASGGSISGASGPATLSRTAANDYTIVMPKANANDVTISFELSDEVDAWSTVSYTRPTWNVKIYRGSTAGTLVLDTSYTADLTLDNPSGTTVRGHRLVTTVSATDVGHGTATGAPLQYVIRITQTAGHTSPPGDAYATRFNMSVKPEGGGYATTLGGLNDVDTAGAVNMSILRYYSGVGQWMPASFVAGTDYIAPGGSGATLTGLNAANITTGTLPVARGGTGATSISGLLKGNGTSAITAATAGIDYVLPSGNVATATKLQTPRAINGSSFDGSGDISTTEWVHSTRDFPLGTLITTSIDYSVTYGDPFILKIEGNSYGNNFPFDIQYQGYIYEQAGLPMINHRGISNGHMISGMVALNVGGYLCFWFPYQSYWQGFNVIVYTAYKTRAVNRVTSITNSAKPAGTKEVALSANIAQSLRSDNYTSYAPSLTGSGASGTWNINVTGSSGSTATLQTARLINGTSFNGSSDITTANWGTSRTITVGSTAKSVNGSGNVSWSLSEIGAFPVSGGTVSGSIVANGFSAGIIDLDALGVTIRSGSAGGGWARGLRVSNSSSAILAGSGFYGTTDSVTNYSVGFGSAWWTNSQFEVTAADTTIRNRLVLSGTTLSQDMMTVFAPAGTVGNDDWVSSPISIKQRGNSSTGAGDIRYSPNLNFHWGGLVSCSLWMNHVGELSYGSYDGTGTPQIDGSFRAGTLYATGNVFGNEYRFTTGDVRLIPSATGFGIHTVSGAAQKIFTGGILVSNSYDSGAISNVPSQGIYSIGSIVTQNKIQSNGIYVLDGNEIRHGYWRHFAFTGFADNIGAADSGIYRKFVKICNASEVLGVFTIRISITGGYNYASGQGETVYIASGNHWGPNTNDIGMYTWHAVQSVGNVSQNAELEGLVIRGSDLGFWLYSVNNNDFTIHMSVRAGNFPPSLGLYGLGTAVERPVAWPTRAPSELTRSLKIASIQGSSAFVNIYQDSGFTNFITDRNLFYFNKGLRMVGGFDIEGTNWFFGAGSQARINQINARHLEGLATNGISYDNVYINYLGGNDVHIGNTGTGGARLVAINKNNEVFAKWMSCWDQRARGLVPPNAYGADLSLEFLAGATAGNSSVDYIGSIVFRPYASHPNDWSGGPMHKIHFDQKLEGTDGGTNSGRIWHQTGNGSGWHSYKEIAQFETNNYFYARSWINIPYGAGLFWGTTGGTHFYSPVDGAIVFRSASATTSYMLFQCQDNYGSPGMKTQGYVYAEQGGNIGFLAADSTWGIRLASNKMVYVTDITISSDSTLKDNQQVIPKALDKLAGISGKTYVRNDTGELGVGVIAQDVLAVLPEAVRTDTSTDTYTVNYNGVIALLVEAVKELQAKVVELEGKAK